MLPRTIVVPSEVMVEIGQHLAAWAEPGPDGRVFIGAKGDPPAS